MKLKIMVTGHREEKLLLYDYSWIQSALLETIESLEETKGVVLGYSGMASGVDIWFCDVLEIFNIPLIACVPFDGQEKYMEKKARQIRQYHLGRAASIKKVRNNYMVEKSDLAIVCWDGNKGGTHNVVQQLIEKNKPFYWINPSGKKVWKCL